MLRLWTVESAGAYEVQCSYSYKFNSVIKHKLISMPFSLILVFPNSDIREHGSIRYLTSKSCYLKKLNELKGRRI